MPTIHTTPARLGSRSRHRVVCAFLALSCAAALAVPATADVVHRSIPTAGTSETCGTISANQCIRVKRQKDHLIGVALVGNDWYDVDTVWLRAENVKTGKSKDLAKNGKKLERHMALFQFDPADVARKLDLTAEDLEAEGFNIQLKLESVGGGSGRQDRCKKFKFRFDNGSWTYSRKGSNYKSIEAEDLFTLKFRADGTVNDVKCGFLEAVTAK